MVPTDSTADKWTKFCSSQNSSNIIPARNQKEAQTNYHEIGGIQIIRECLTSAGVSQTAADIIMQSWRPPTTKQYGCYLKRWVQFCLEQNIDKINPSLGEMLAFLTKLHNDGLSYSAIYTAKSTLSSMFEIIHKRDITKEILIQRFMKGYYHIPQNYIYLGC